MTSEAGAALSKGAATAVSAAWSAMRRPWRARRHARWPDLFSITSGSPRIAGATACGIRKYEMRLCRIFLAAQCLPGRAAAWACRMSAARIPKAHGRPRRLPCLGRCAASRIFCPGGFCAALVPWPWSVPPAPGSGARGRPASAARPQFPRLLDCLIRLFFSSLSFPILRGACAKQGRPRRACHGPARGIWMRTLFIL